MSGATVASLVDALEELQLLEPPQWQELASLQPRPKEPRELLRALLSRGWLTRFQAATLLKGNHRALLHGPYLLIEQLGEGGMGQVYKARHQKLGRVVALKIIHKDRLRDPKAVSRFHREMQAVGALHHPNIIQAYDAGEAEGGYFLAMEFVDGPDLARLLREIGRLPIHRACDYIRQAALGLQHAHDRGMVHRDIKPSNLLLARQPSGEPSAAEGDTRDAAAPSPPRTEALAPATQTTVQRPAVEVDPGPGTIKVLDLGLARLERSASGESLSQVTCDNLVIGTPDYIAPEQAASPHSVDVRADIYSLGCTLYHLLTGRIPFPGQTLMEKLIKHRTELAEPVSSLRPEVPPELSDLVSRMMAKEPQARPASAAEVADALLPFCAPQPPPAATSDPPTEKTRQPGPEKKRRFRRLAKAERVADRELEETPTQADDTIFPNTPSVLLTQMNRKADQRAAATWLAVSIASVILTGTLIGALLFIVRGYSAGPGSSGGSSTRSVSKTSPPPTTPEVPPNRASTSPSGGATVEREWLALASRSSRASETDLEIRRDLLAFASRQQGTPYSGRAIRTFLGLPSLLDGHKARPVGNNGEAWNVVLDLGREPLFGPFRRPSQAVAFSADGKWLAAGIQDRLHLWSMETDPDDEMRTIGQHREAIRQLVFSPDGSLVLSVSGERERAVRVFDVSTGEERLAVGVLPRTSGTCGDFSPDKKHLLIGGDRVLSLWKVEGMEAVRLLKQEAMGLLQAVAFLPDSNWAVSVGQDGVLRLWEVESGSESRTFGSHNGEVTGLAVAYDGRFAVTSSLDQSLRFWNLSDGNLVGQYDAGKPLLDLSLSPDGQLCAAVAQDGSVHLVEAPTGQPQAVLHPLSEYSPPAGVAFAYDGRHLAVVTKRGKVLVLRLGR